MDYEIINYDEKYDDEIYEFQKPLWTADSNLNRNYFRWKYIDNPVSDVPKIYLVLSSGKLIAFRGMHDMHWQIGGTPNRFIALSSTDLHIHKDYRNEGIYTNLMNFVLRDLNEKGYRYIFNFSAGNVNYINSLAMGWKSIGDIHTIKMTKKIQRNEPSAIKFARRMLWKTGAAQKLKELLRIGQSMNRIYHRSKTEPQSRLAVEDRPKPKEMATLVKDLVPKNKITLIRDETYFSWRYNNPMSKYLFLYLYDKGLKGYLVLGNNELLIQDYDTYKIFELEAATSPIKIELLNHLINTIDSGTISVWESMLDQDCLDYLISQGFTKGNLRKSVKDYTQTVLIKPLDNDNRFKYQGLNLLDSQNWDLKMSYVHDY